MDALCTRIKDIKQLRRGELNDSPQEYRNSDVCSLLPLATAHNPDNNINGKNWRHTEMPGFLILTGALV